jgi:hypothetical protein
MAPLAGLTRGARLPIRSRMFDRLRGSSRNGLQRPRKPSWALRAGIARIRTVERNGYVGQTGLLGGARDLPSSVTTRRAASRRRQYSQPPADTSVGFASWAPWYVIPADHKWFSRICVSAVLVDTLINIDPQYPHPPADELSELAQAKAILEAQAPAGAAADPFEAELIARGGKGERRAAHRDEV